MTARFSLFDVAILRQGFDNLFIFILWSLIGIFPLVDTGGASVSQAAAPMPSLPWSCALLLTCLLAFLHASESSEIISKAQCHSRCLGLYQSAKKSQSLEQCLKPCQEKNLTKLWLCYDYCSGFPDDGAPCHYSCKFIKKLHNKGFVQGKCSSAKRHDEEAVCTRNKHCSELTKCCYNLCKEIKVDGKGVKAKVSGITSSSLILEWQRSNVTNAIYILQMRILHSSTIYYDESDWGKWQHKWQGSDVVQIKFVSIHSGVRLQFRVAVVDRTGLQSIGPPTPVIQTLFNASRPSSPEKIWVLSKTYKSKKVDIILCWLPPIILDVPVHSYRLFWKQIPQTFVNGAIVETERTRISGGQLNYTIKGLQVGKMYMVEIQAVCRWKKARLKSKKLSINISTEYPKGSDKDEVVVVTNISNVSQKQHNNSSSYGDDDVEEVEVIVEPDEGNSANDRNHGEGSHDGRNCGGGAVYIHLWLLLMPCLLFQCLTQGI